MRRAVFLDRDGVLNRAIIRDGKPNSPSTLAEVDILPGVSQALQRLHDAGFLLIVVTNQPDVARGVTPRACVEAIHAHMRERLTLDDIRVCFHDDRDRCACRKPSPGMVYAAAVEREIDLAGSYLVGDRWRDIAAGQRAGCTTILVDGGNDEQTTIEPDVRINDLPDAAQWILARG